MDEIRIGFDVGVHGAIAVFRNDELYLKREFPLIKDEDGKDSVDLDALSSILLDVAGLSSDVYCFIENVHAIWGSSAGSTFMFGRQLGRLEGLVQGMGLPYSLVSPKMWQGEMWKGIERIKLPKKTKTGKVRNDTKAISELTAKTLFPNEDFRKNSRCRIFHDGIVDAVLIAEYCRRMRKPKEPLKDNAPIKDAYKYGYFQG